MKFFTSYNFPLYYSLSRLMRCGCGWWWWWCSAVNQQGFHHNFHQTIDSYCMIFTQSLDYLRLTDKEWRRQRINMTLLFTRVNTHQFSIKSLYLMALIYFQEQVSSVIGIKVFVGGGNTIFMNKNYEFHEDWEWNKTHKLISLMPISI